MTTQESSEPLLGGARGRTYEISFPAASANGGLDQDEEWCEVTVDGSPRRVRFHDYHEIYSLPGLYEQLFYDHLGCDSPRTVIGELERELRDSQVDPDDLVALDVGAGNGMVGEELAATGVGSIVGIDIIAEAAEAAERDRPGLYEDYFVEDLTALPDGVRRDLEGRGFNALTCVAALGFGDIPPAAFAIAYDLVQPGGFLAFNIKEDFLTAHSHGFSGLIRTLIDRGMLELRGQQRYRHRDAFDGTPLHYVAIVAVKQNAESALKLAIDD